MKRELERLRKIGVMSVRVMWMPRLNVYRVEGFRYKTRRVNVRSRLSQWESCDGRTATQALKLLHVRFSAQLWPSDNSTNWI